MPNHLTKTLLFALIPLSLISILFFLRPIPTFRQTLDHTFSHSTNPLNPFPPPPKIAYFISGSRGDRSRILRLLHAVFHPRNQYLLHLDSSASDNEREELVVSIGSVEVFAAAENVNVVGKADAVNYDGSTPLALVLHGAAILLRLKQDWDWFVNLDASDYPVVSQDDFLHIMSYVPKSSNFIEHTSTIEDNEYQRITEVVVDPSTYLGLRGKMFTGSRKRKLPEAYRFFTGSPHVVLSRQFVDFLILGWDNLPRTLLLYFTNIKLSHQGYFQTLACNSKEFSNTVMNSSLHFTAHEDNLKVSNVKNMLLKGTAFAGKFVENDPVLDLIDLMVLHRDHGMVSPGGWCLGKRVWGRDPCNQWGDIDILRPGPASKRLEKLLLRLMDNSTSGLNRCV